MHGGEAAFPKIAQRSYSRFICFLLFLCPLFPERSSPDLAAPAAAIAFAHCSPPSRAVCQRRGNENPECAGIDFPAPSAISYKNRSGL
jgi:hypothetical protein